MRRKKRGHVPIPTEGEGIVITRKTTRITVQFVPGARGGMPLAQDDLKLGARPGVRRPSGAFCGGIVVMHSHKQHRKVLLFCAHGLRE